MPSEMLSGPDLGAGFLHQLTTDRDGDRTTFTYHAQDGGADANGPPKGPLDVLGFIHPPTPCPFGGPRCWHRRFLLPFAETPRVRASYNRFRFVLQAMIDQAYAQVPVAVGPALAELVGRLGRPEGGLESADWYVGGSTAAWILGAPVQPRDIDLGCSREAVDRIGAALPEYLIEPIATTDWPSVGIVRGARAFVGTFASGARVEWAVPLDPERRSPDDEWSGPRAGTRLWSAPFRGGSIPVARPEYSLVRRARPSGRGEFAELARWLGRFGPDWPLLDRLCERAALPPARRDELRAAVRAGVAARPAGFPVEP